MDVPRLETKLHIKFSFIPLILAAAVGITYLLGIPLGSAAGPLNLAIWLYAGAICADTLSKGPTSRVRGRSRSFSMQPHAVDPGRPLRSSLFQIAGNGALLAGLCFIVYEIALGISLSAQQGPQAISFGGVVIGLIEAALIGAVGTLAWYALSQSSSLIQTQQETPVQTKAEAVVRTKQETASATSVQSKLANPGTPATQGSKVKMSANMPTVSTPSQVRGSTNLIGAAPQAAKTDGEPALIQDTTSKPSKLKIGSNLQPTSADAESTASQEDTQTSKLKTKMRK